MSVTATPRIKGHPGYSQTMRRAPESAEVARKLVRTALTDRWGTDRYRWGKQVWGEMKCD
ncbi:hypothetical protein ACWELB_39825 [Streptomyces asiaticus]